MNYLTKYLINNSSDLKLKVIPKGPKASLERTKWMTNTIVSMQWNYIAVFAVQKFNKHFWHIVLFI